jgi:hypothetical protein
MFGGSSCCDLKVWYVFPHQQRIVMTRQNESGPRVQNKTR